MNANYIKSKLEHLYEIKYVGDNGRVAHEVIIDCNCFKKHGITEEDIAKRLIDYGFHAPTMSFPFSGALMIEPTESEDKPEIDRFILSLVRIREEIQDIIDGKVDKDQNVLKLAPFTLQAVS